MQYHQEYTIYGTCFWLSMLPKSRKSIFCIQCFAKLSLWSLYLFTLQSALCKKRGDRIQNIVAYSFCLLAPLCVEEVMGLPKTEKLALFYFFSLWIEDKGWKGKEEGFTFSANAESAKPQDPSLNKTWQYNRQHFKSTDQPTQRVVFAISQEEICRPEKSVVHYIKNDCFCFQQ